MPSLRQALEDIDSGCIYGNYSIPWEMIAAKHDKLEVVSDDSKQLEDSKPVSNSTLSEDSKTSRCTQQTIGRGESGGCSHS